MHLYHGKNTEITELSVAPFVIRESKSRSVKEAHDGMKLERSPYPACHMRNSWDH